jgi:hypothetical protein
MEDQIAAVVLAPIDVIKIIRAYARPRLYKHESDYWYGDKFYLMKKTSIISRTIYYDIAQMYDNDYLCTAFNNVMVIKNLETSVEHQHQLQHDIYRIKASKNYLFVEHTNGIKKYYIKSDLSVEYCDEHTTGHTLKYVDDQVLILMHSDSMVIMTHDFKVIRRHHIIRGLYKVFKYDDMIWISLGYTRLHGHYYKLDAEWQIHQMP